MPTFPGKTVPDSLFRSPLHIAAHNPYTHTDQQRNLHLSDILHSLPTLSSKVFSFHSPGNTGSASVLHHTIFSQFLHSDISQEFQNDPLPACRHESPSEPALKLILPLSLTPYPLSAFRIPH